MTDFNINTDYEPKRDLWPKYEPWMRDVLADDARMSWLGSGVEYRATWAYLDLDNTGWVLDHNVRIHPEDCPDKPADPVEELAKVILEADTTNSWHWNELGVFDVQHYIDMAQAALDHIEAGEQS